MLASEIISLPVISIYSGNQIGIVENMVFNTKSKKCIYIIIFNEEENITYALPTSRIYKQGSDCIFIKNESVLILTDSIELELNNLFNPISTKLYSLSCKYLGNISDLELTQKYNIKKFIITKQSIESSQIISFSNSISIFSESPVSISNFKQKKLKIKNNNLNTVTIEHDSSIDLKKPIKAITDFGFLLNRTTTKDILTPNGEIIIKAGTTVTPIIINKARNNGKFIELTHFSK